MRQAPAPRTGRFIPAVSVGELAYRVISAAMKGGTAQDPPQSHESPFERSEPLQGFHGILRAGRAVSTGAWDVRRDGPLVEVDEGDECIIDELAQFTFHTQHALHAPYRPHARVALSNMF